MQTRDKIDTFTKDANEPKEALMRLHRRISNSIGSDSGIARQLSQVIADLEAWQNR